MEEAGPVLLLIGLWCRLRLEFVSERVLQAPFFCYGILVAFEGLHAGNVVSVAFTLGCSERKYDDRRNVSAK